MEEFLKTWNENPRGTCIISQTRPPFCLWTQLQIFPPACHHPTDGGKHSSGFVKASIFRMDLFSSYCIRDSLQVHHLPTTGSFSHRIVPPHSFFVAFICCPYRSMSKGWLHTATARKDVSRVVLQAKHPLSPQHLASFLESLSRPNLKLLQYVFCPFLFQLFVLIIYKNHIDMG